MNIKDMMAQAHIFIHFGAVSSSILCKNSNCMLRNFTSFLLVLLIFFLMCGWGLAVAMHVQCSVVNSDVLLHYFTNIVARNAENSV